MKSGLLFAFYLPELQGPVSAYPLRKSFWKATSRLVGTEGDTAQLVEGAASVKSDDRLTH